MATPLNSLNKSNLIQKSMQINNFGLDFTNNCSVVVHKLDESLIPVQVKRKRGRPKKNITKDQNKALIASNTNRKHLVKSESVTGLKSTVTVAPTVKRGRGRPKKNEIISNIVPPTPQVVLNEALPKKRGRKKRNITNIKAGTDKFKSIILENKDTSEVPNDCKSSKLDNNENSDCFNSKKMIYVDKMLMNESSTTSGELEMNENNTITTKTASKTFDTETMSPSNGCHFTPGRFDCSNFEKNTESIKSIKVEHIGSPSDKEQDVLLKFGKVHENILPQRTRSMSVSDNEFTKTRYRRNSLSDNFVFSSSVISKTNNETDTIKINKSWKSLSYLESGPNIQIERYQRNQLYKKFRTELKRSRSFPNCMLLDTVIWRFLVYEEDYETEDNFEMMSDSEVDLLNELPLDEYYHEYRSKSVPIEEYEYKTENFNENNKLISKSLDSLNISFCFDDTSIQINQSPDACEVEDTESEAEECQRNIRRSKRIKIKKKRFKKINKKYFLECENLKRASLLLGEQIREENERQLEEAKRNDPELNKKLTKLNFTFINNNLFRPHRKDMSKYTQAEAQELRKLKHRKVFSTYLIRCECKYSEEDWINGKPGCGSGCVNRALNVECGPWCPIKSFCTNKQFQNKQFKRTEIVKTPNKGYGVFALEDIPSGTFIDEYVGEVIDHKQMIKRMKTKLYTNNNYMVELKHNEIIDATCKGNITRFINHSCEPNCSAEKWIVSGESRMGFFSNVSIFKGEEITFDYSFQFFGKTAQQSCYCGAPKCRGFIGTKSRTIDFSSSDESDDDETDILISKPDELKEKKKKLLSKKIANKEKKRLRELNQQLTDISKLKNKNRSDLESSTLNLNKLMVHITDSMSRSHILKFIRENDLNCKRLFMNFNGLSIIYSWMISSNNENLKLEIIQTLSELPISNRNTITKSKVIDVVGEWANIPPNTKEVIENLDYPISKSKEHGLEVDKLLPNDNSISLLEQTARDLWKKWIILKMAFKIPKLERPKEVVTPNVISKSSIISQPTPKPDNFNFEKPIIHASQHSKLNHKPFENKLKCIKNVQSQKFTPDNELKLTNSMDKFSKIIHHQNLINNQEKSKAVREWNRKNWEYALLKTNKDDNSVAVNNSNNFVLNKKGGPTRLFKSITIQQEIPTIENIPIKKNKQNTKFVPVVYEVPTNSGTKSNTTTNIVETKPVKYYSIEEIITSNKTQGPPVPTITELQKGSTLDSIIKFPPPCKNPINETKQYSNLSLLWTFMKPENINYDAQHPNLQEQSALMSVETTANSNSNIVINSSSYTSFETFDILTPIETPSSYYNNTIIEISDGISEETAFIPIKTTVNNNTNVMIDLSDVSSKKTDSDENRMVIKSSRENIQKLLLKQSENNLKKLYDRGLLDICKSARKNYVDQSPIKISPSFFKIKLNNNFVLPNFFKCLKVVSNFYRQQPCKMIKINNLKSKSLTQKNKNHIFRIKEEKKTEKTDLSSVALKLYKKQLNTVPQNLNMRKLFKKQSIKLETENKFAYKIWNGLKKKCLAMPKQFTLQLPPDTKIYTQDPKEEIEFHNKLIPNVENTLCARLRKGDDKDTINVFKQQITMKYDESKVPRPFKSLESVFKENLEKSKTIEINNHHKLIKRKLPLPEIHNMKIKKRCDSSTKLITSSKDKYKVSVKNQMHDDTVFKKPMVPPLKNVHRNNRVSVQRRQKATSGTKVPNVALLQGNTNEITLEPSTSNQIIQSTDLLKTNANEIRQKPLMKCLPFNKVNNISASELEQNVNNLAVNLSMDYSTNVVPSTQSSSELIDPIVNHFNASLSTKKTKERTNLVDDPIVRDYIRTQLETSESKRKYKLPESMMSLPVEVLNLVPDNQRDIKYIVDFYHSMATVIVRVLDSYVKKSCRQGRIKNDDDFKYLAKKLNSNILFKELQVKKVEDLKISDSVKQKVEQYIKKYMLKYGKLYRRKTTDQ